MAGNGVMDRWKWGLPFVVIAMILFTFSMYQWIIPRTDLEVRTVYHEAPGGGGTGGTININVLLTNQGNRDIDDLECIVWVRSGEGEVLSFKEVKNVFLGSRENTEMKLVIVGSHYSVYKIAVELLFHSVGSDHSRDLDYSTSEDAMNLVFVENLP
ncbi:MAG: hypothetical protein U9R75_10740 [Candidatus Thermoplasmatota archaeon]|nr:hypothetical protein [Candidatus Thermoplasmatota archaeon]